MQPVAAAAGHELHFYCGRMSPGRHLHTKRAAAPASGAGERAASTRRPTTRRRSRAACREKYPPAAGSDDCTTQRREALHPVIGIEERRFYHIMYNKKREIGGVTKIDMMYNSATQKEHRYACLRSSISYRSGISFELPQTPLQQFQYRFYMAPYEDFDAAHARETLV